jgi:hypothetical protein
MYFFVNNFFLHFLYSIEVGSHISALKTFMICSIAQHNKTFVSMTIVPWSAPFAISMTLPVIGLQ